MSLAVMLLSLLSATPDGFSPPPLLTVEPGPTTAPLPPPQPAPEPPPPTPRAAPQPAPQQPTSTQQPGSFSQPGYDQTPRDEPAASATREREARPDSDVPAFGLRALATGNYSLKSGAVGVGGRAELDVFRIGLSFSYERTLFSEVTSFETQAMTGLLSVAPVATKNLRLRVLGGVDLRLTPSAPSFGPVFGVNGRLGASWIGIDAFATLTPLPFRRLEARAAVFVKSGPVELQAGYQVRLLDTAAGSTLATLFSTTPEAGPYAALGVSL